MRVLLAAPQPFYRDRGTPIAIRQVLEALSESGHEVDLLTFPMGETISLPGLQTFRVKSPLRIRELPIGFSLGKLWLDLLMVFAIRGRLRRRQYDAVHAVEEAAFPCAVMAKRRGIPLIYDMQSNLPEQLEAHPFFKGRWRQALLKRLEAWLVGHADLIACSTGLEEHVRSIDRTAEVREWRFASARTTVDARDVDRLRHELEIPAGASVVLYSGNFAAYQGVPLLLAAATQVHSELPEAVFVLVGAEGPGDVALAASLTGSEDTSFLRVVERQPRTAMPLYLELADVLVSPRDHGGNLPLKIFDYLAAAKPIVATDTATHRTILDETRAILVGLSAQELALSITMVVRDSQQAERLGEAAGVWARENLGWEAFREDVELIYRAAGRESQRSGEVE